MPMKDPTTKKYKLLITDGQKTHTIWGQKEELLLDVFQKHGILIPASCGGKGTCEKCKVKIAGKGMELACQYRINDDMAVILPGFKEYAILDQLNPHARPITDNSGIEIKYDAGQKRVTYKGELIASTADEENQRPVGYGLAVDIGTTTIVMYLLDIVYYQPVDVISVLNPQISFGADVISRIDYCIREPEGLKTLQKKLIDQINESIDSSCQAAGIKSDDIYLMTIVGNTIMLHILLGVDPASIAFAPYTPVFTDEKVLKASTLDLKINRKGIVKVLPSVAGYVGADILAGLASTDIADNKNHTLYIDIGTNGEIVLGNRDIIYCCATAAGPAFEGAKIKCGVGGVEGGISVYNNGYYKTIGDKAPVGICGSGLIDLIAFLLESNRIDYSGYMTEEFLVEKKEHTAVDHDIVVTQKDIREVQLAKAAIYAGIMTLIRIAGISIDQIENVYLAGGFGNYIRTASAIRIGLLPEAFNDKIIPIGNSAGTGALQALRSLEFEREIDRVLKITKYIELSMRADFNEEYLSAMHFPVSQ
jgi:uncharacterized 2Fe-2S/4Fe-4S cluster protein (DUF4445 family)